MATSSSYYTSPAVWYTWVASTAPSSTSTSYSTVYSTSSQVWDSWITSTNSYTTSTSVSNTYIWYRWVDSTPQALDVVEQEADLRVESREVVAVEPEPYAEVVKRKEKAEGIAKELLLELLSKEQRAVFEKYSRVFVRGEKGLYLIPKTGHVQLIESANPDTVVDLCVHLAEKHHYPEFDNLITLKLGFEGEEEKVINTANRHQSRLAGPFEKEVMRFISEQEKRVAC